jgi:hypothetical protein
MAVLALSIRRTTGRMLSLLPESNRHRLRRKFLLWQRRARDMQVGSYS